MPEKSTRQAPAGPPRRLLFDISTSLRWSGPPVGIVRVERALASAFRSDPNCKLVFFDPNVQLYREVRREHVEDLLEGRAALDTTGLKDPSQSRPRKTDRVPRFLLSPFLWITQFRRMAIGALERRRLHATTAFVRKLVSSLQLFIGGKKYRGALLLQDGNRCSILSVDVATYEPLPLQSEDLIFFAGCNWSHSNVHYIQAQSHIHSVQLVMLCYDIIPLLFPNFFKSHDVALMRRYFDLAFPLASLVLTTCPAVQKDVEGYCRTNGLTTPPIRQVPLGFDLNIGRERQLSPELAPYRYVLFVSTIEPRKGHRLIHSVWTRLIEEGLIAKVDFKLVLVGRPGWMVQDLIADLSTTDRLLMMSDVDDDMLAELYDKAAFCVYPSEYEGYGLPVVEALARGKTVLSSTVGIIPELHASRLKKLPPKDVDRWYSAIKDTINAQPDLEGSGDFRHPTWEEAAGEFLAAIRSR